MVDRVLFEKFCPRCDKRFTSVASAKIAMNAVKRHVSKAHPDFDEEWANE